jgi:hypothetical protein
MVPSHRKKQVAKLIGLDQPRNRKASRRSLGLVKPESRAQYTRLAAHRTRRLASEPVLVHQLRRRWPNLIRSRLVRAPMQGLHHVRRWNRVINLIITQCFRASCRAFASHCSVPLFGPLSSAGSADLSTYGVSGVRCCRGSIMTTHPVPQVLMNV